MKCYRRSKAIFACLLMLLLLLSAGCAEKTEPTVEHISSLLAEKTEDDLFKQSLLIVKGKVSAVSDSFQVRSTAGGTQTYTDYTVNPSEVLRGSFQGKSLTVRLPGGTVGNVTTVYDHCPDLQKGEEYILFLYQLGYGSTYATKEDYYNILGLTQGVFQLSAEDSSADAPVYRSQSGSTLAASVLTARANEYPVDPLYFRNEYLANQKTNLENGIITQAKYDEIISAIDTYATRMD